MPCIYRLIGFASLAANSAVLTTRDSAPAAAPVAAAAVPLTPPARPATTVRDSDGLFHLTGRTGARTVNFVVDTGASVTVLTAADARRLGTRALAHGDAMMATAGGQTAIAWHRLPASRIAGRRIAALDVAVVENGIGQSLLGQDILAQLGTIVISDDRLELR